MRRREPWRKWHSGSGVCKGPGVGKAGHVGRTERGAHG